MVLQLLKHYFIIINVYIIPDINYEVNLIYSEFLIYITNVWGKR